MDTSYCLHVSHMAFESDVGTSSTVGGFISKDILNRQMQLDILKDLVRVLLELRVHCVTNFMADETTLYGDHPRSTGSLPGHDPHQGLTSA